MIFFATSVTALNVSVMLRFTTFSFKFLGECKLWHHLHNSMSLFHGYISLFGYNDRKKVSECHVSYVGIAHIDLRPKINHTIGQDL